MRNYYITIIAIFSCFVALGQVAQPSAQVNKHQIRGRVVDSTNISITAAVISLLDGGKVVEAAVTDSLGQFVISTSSQSGKINVSHISFKDHNQNININGNTNIGDITLQRSAMVLADVNVVGSYTKREGANYTVRLKNNPLAEDRSALSFMGTVPGVRGISIQGKAPSMVYVNGMQLKMAPEEILKYLAAMQATDVETIKIMPSRGVKHNANHKGGVIHIQMNKSDYRQFSGSISPSLDVNFYDGAVAPELPITLNYMSKKLSSYTYISPSYMQNEATEKVFELDNQKDSTISNRTFYVFNINQSLVYDINKKHSIGLALRSAIKPSETTETLTYDEDKNTRSNINSNISLYQYGGAVNYKFNFDDLGSFVQLTGDYLHHRDNYSESYTTSNNQKELTLTGNIKNTASADITSTINFKDEKSSLSLGADYLDVNAIQRYSYDNATPDRYKYKERSYSAYAEFYTLFGDGLFDMTLGARYEGANIIWSYSNPNIVNKGRRDFFNDFVPSIALVYNPKSGTNFLTLDYTRSISRPTMGDYDPVVYRESNNVFQVGAANLLPEYEDILSLTWTYKNKHIFRFSYISDNDIYDNIYTQKGDSLLISYENMGSKHQAELYASTSFWIAKNRLKLDADATGSFARLNNKTFGVTDVWEARISATLTTYLPKKWRISIYGNYSTPSLTPTYKISAGWGMNASVHKTFSNKFRITIFARNLIYSKNLTIASRQPDVLYVSHGRNYFQNFGVSATYKFGSSKLNSVKRAKENFNAQMRGGSSY